MAEHNALGQLGENIAVQYIEQKGYSILARNWRFQKAELDIVAKDQEELVIIEVKTRTTAAIDDPQNAVTRSKQKLIIKAANAFIEQHDIDLECRFDIITVITGVNPPEIEHLQSAFYPLV